MKHPLKITEVNVSSASCRMKNLMGLTFQKIDTETEWTGSAFRQGEKYR
jgi:hypothetical protein